MAALLLADAGVAKLRRPAPTGLALARAGLPGRDPVVRALGAAECVLAVAAVAVGGSVLWLLAAAYGAFAAYVALQLHRARAAGTVADCGCFGDLDAPLEGSHAVVDVLLALGAAWGAVAGVTVVGDLLDDPGAGLVVVGLSLVGVVAVRALMTDLPRVRAWRRLEAGS